MNLDARDVADRLREQLDSLVPQLLPDGRMEGHEWRGRGADGAVWSVVMRGGKRGVWASWGDDRMRGDPLELVRWAVCGGDRKLAFGWAMRWLGLERGQAAPISAEERARREEATREAVRKAELDAERTRSVAHSMWLAGGPIAGTPAAEYLAGRGIGPERFPPKSLRALRFHPSLRHPSGIELPALLAAVVHASTGKHVATQRIFLERPGGVWRKAQRHPNKPLLGAFGGGIIPLLRGESTRPWREATDADQLLIGEGIENTLTVALAYPEMRAVAAVSVGNIAAIEIPAAIVNVMLIRDCDGENQGVQHAVQKAIARWSREKRAIAQWLPPEGYDDANAWWLDMLAAQQGRVSGVERSGSADRAA